MDYLGLVNYMMMYYFVLQLKHDIDHNESCPSQESCRSDFLILYGLLRIGLPYDKHYSVLQLKPAIHHKEPCPSQDFCIF